MTGTAQNLDKHAILRDGGSIRLRALRADDKERLREHFGRLSPESRYFRFLGVKKELTKEELTRLTELDFTDHVGLAATLIRNGREEIIGVGRYIRVPAPAATPRAEVAFAVEDKEQHRGIGTLLLQELAGIARREGIVELEADTLAENRAMLEVFRDCGFEAKRAVSSGVYHVLLEAKETDALRQAVERRERVAARSSLRAILEPKSVAVVGASRREGSISGAVLANLIEGGFRGPIYPVNPNAATLRGLRCHPTVSSIGRPVDLAVIAVPAAHVADAAADCARAGVRGLVVISAGFAEVSKSGKAAQDQLRDAVRASGLRMVGPNCMGVLNTDPQVRLNASFAPEQPNAGNVAMLTQSGALGLALLDYTRALRLGVSTFVSVGNKADISGNDLLAYWEDDPKTSVVALYLESFGNPRKFARLAPIVARKKPIVAVKSGRSEAGRRAAASHSAALASADLAVDALFEQAGVIRTETLEEMLDVVSLLSSQPLPSGRRAAIVTNAGGPGILLADACEAAKIEVPKLGEATIERLRSYLPAEAGLSNPIDMIASASPEDFERTIELAGADPAADAVIAVYIPPLAGEREKIAAAIARGAGKVPADKPVLVVFISSDGAPGELFQGPRGNLPCYSFPENAARALGAALEYCDWKKRPIGREFRFDAASTEKIRAVIDAAKARAAVDSELWLRPHELDALLSAAGIEVAKSELIAVDHAGDAAERLGYPLVAKAVARGVLHKSDLGLVLTDLGSRAEVEVAARSIAERTAALGKELEGVLLQQQVRGGLETIVGVTTDPTFGPLVVCGLGGALVELVGDVAFRLTPVTDVDAAEMLEKLRAKKLFDGYRGAPRRDRAALEALILRVSALVELIPELAELDLNPVEVLPDGGGAIVVDARLRLAEGLETKS